MKIIFMGTPDFAVPSLKALINSSAHEVVAVFTQVPKAQGRGMVKKSSAVGQLADKYSLPIYTPETLKSIEIQNLIHFIPADIIVVVAYGFIIPKAILEAKKYGCLNVHPSLLPKYRGAAPMQRTIINGDNETAVCIMQMDEGLDTGDILMQEKFSLPHNITYSILHYKCAEIGAELLIKTLNNIRILPKIKQETNEEVVYAFKLKKEEGKIDWRQNACKIDCKIRGMNPWPGAFFEFENKLIKILESEYINQNHNFEPGIVIDNELTVACGDNLLKIKKLQQQDKKPLNTKEFLLGSSIKKGTKLL